MKNGILTVIVVLSGLFSVSNAQEQPGEKVLLNPEEAARLASLPLKCMQKVYPARLSQTLANQAELLEPAVLHPAFFGCFDWHSSVHGHWMLICLLKLFPDLPNAPEIRRKLIENLTASNILKEAEYFRKPHEKAYERTYGWAWLLKLAEELHTWDDPLARMLEVNLQPLTEEIVGLYLNFLPRLNYPVRVGEHTNTAFGFSFAWDYANTTANDSLRQAIAKRARDFYYNDKNCPVAWEPGGYDFFSPCFEEADLMRRILPLDEYRTWLNGFMPQLSDPGFHLEAARVSDRTDGKLVHLDGLNFSRARCLNGIATTLPGYFHLKPLAMKHILHSLQSITDGSYEGEHWLATFALLALMGGE